MKSPSDRRLPACEYNSYTHFCDFDADAKDTQASSLRSDKGGKR